MQIYPCIKSSGVNMKILVFSTLLFIGATAQAATLNARNATELVTALSRAKAGDTVSLAAGDYGALKWNGTTTKHKFLSQYTGEVKITSASLTNRAVISSFEAFALKNVTFTGVNFRSLGAARLVHVGLSEKVKFDNVNFIGRAVNGYGTGVGLNMSSNNKAITIQNSKFEYFSSALTLFNIDGLVIDNNDMVNIAYDVLQIGYVYNVLIQNNLMVKKSNPSGDSHQDLIQIANNNTSAEAARDIIIRNNYLEASDSKTHGIYIDNRKSQGSGNKQHFFKNIRIENNDIYTGQTLAIAVAETTGLVVMGNDVIQHDKVTSTHPVAIPAIRIGYRTTGVSVTGNRTHFTPVAADNMNNWTPRTGLPSGWKLSPNTLAPL